MWFLLVLGLCLIFVFVAIFRVSTQGVSNPTVAGIVEARFCNSEETVIERQGPSSSSAFSPFTNHPTTLVYCEADDGSRRDITIPYATFSMMVSGIPFLLGLLLLIGSMSGIVLQTRHARARTYQQ
jgi:hypothetical protein